MFEKLKDILYDLNDIFISIILISVIFLAVSWKLDDSLAFSFSSENDLPVIENEELISDNGNSEELEVVVITPINEETSSDDNLNETTDPGAIDTPTVEPSTETPAIDVKPKTEKTFVVNSGTTGYQISLDLESQGFVDSSSDFLVRLEERGLGFKLQSGDFTLYTSDTIDDIINVLTRQGRE